MEHSVTRPLSPPASATVPLLSGQGNYCLVLIPEPLILFGGLSRNRYRKSLEQFEGVLLSYQRSMAGSFYIIRSTYRGSEHGSTS